MAEGGAEKGSGFETKPGAGRSKWEIYPAANTGHGKGSHKDVNVPYTFIPPPDLKFLAKCGYEFETDIGHGNFGEVWKCCYISDAQQTRTPLACKRVTITEMGLSRQIAERRVAKFNNEKQALLTAKHDNVIDTHNIWVNYESMTAQMPYYALFFTELADGDLDNYCGDYDDKNHTGLPEAHARHWFRQIVAGVEYLHSMLIAHRDLKPANVLYIERKDTTAASSSSSSDTQFAYLVKLCDFGLCHIGVEADPQSMLARDSVGTKKFRAPEQAEADRTQQPYDPFKADIYSLGLLLFYMVTIQSKRDVQFGSGQSTDKVVYVSQQIEHIWRQTYRTSAENRWTIEQIRQSEWMNMSA